MSVEIVMPRAGLTMVEGTIGTWKAAEGSHVSKGDVIMEYENEKVFVYVEQLLRGEHPEGYSIGVFARHHDQINAKLTELKNIIIKYYPASGDNQLLNATLFDIFSCEEDLASHNRVEDYLFVPAIMELEKEAK